MPQAGMGNARADEDARVDMKAAAHIYLSAALPDG
jgi:hypothetical protein